VFLLLLLALTLSDFGDSLKSSLSSASKKAGDFYGHLRNEADTVGDVLEKTPSAIWNEIHGDAKTGFKGHLDREISVGVGLVLGAGTLLLARRAPAIASALAESSFMKGTAAMGTGAEGISFLSGTASLLSDGWNANTSDKREKLADTYSRGVGANLAPIAETVVAGGIGAVAADRALAFSPKFNAATFEALTEKRDYFFRSQFQATPEKLFAGPGSFSLSSDVALGGNRANMNALTTQLEKSPVGAFKRFLYKDDSNVEVVREISLADGKVSVPLRGTPWGSQTPRLPEGLTDHNHHELTGIMISADDAANANGLNIVRSGDYRGYYIGQRENLASAQAEMPTVVSSGEARVRPALNQLVVNDKEQRAFLLQSPQTELSGANINRTWRAAPQYIEYKSAKLMLNDVDVTTSGAEKAFASLPRISSEPHQEDIKAITTLPASVERNVKLAGTRY
jgi:hypothetical protein